MLYTTVLYIYGSSGPKELSGLELAFVVAPTKQSHSREPPTTFTRHRSCLIGHDSPQCFITIDVQLGQWEIEWTIYSQELSYDLALWKRRVQGIVLGSSFMPVVHCRSVTTSKVH